MHTHHWTSCEGRLLDGCAEPTRIKITSMWTFLRSRSAVTCWALGRTSLCLDAQPPDVVHSTRAPRNQAGIPGEQWQGRRHKGPNPVMSTSTAKWIDCSTLVLKPTGLGKLADIPIRLQAGPDI